MSTLIIEDASAELKARIADAKIKRDMLGITPLEHRPVRESLGIPLYFDPNIPVQTIVDALRAGGLTCKIHGGRYVVRPR